MGRTRKTAEQPNADAKAEANDRKPSDGKSKGETSAIRVASDIAEMLGTISSIRHETIAVIISDPLRPIVRAMYAEALKQAASKLDVQ